jgi:hypothetical protein
MIKKTLYLLVITLVIFTSSITASNLDSTLYTSNLKAYTWEPISDVENILQYENPKNLTKRAIDQSKLAEVHYTSAVKLMKKKEYSSAINEFKSAMKRYKRAKLSDDGLNFIRINMALCYANSGNNEDIALSKRFLNLVTSKIYSNNNWTYNTAIAHNKVGNFSEAASFLSSIIRKDEFNFQSYVTLEDIYRNSGNEKDADKVIERMETAKAKLIDQNQKSKPSKNQKTEKEENKKFIPKGERPDINNLKILSKDDHLQFNKVDKINDRSMIQIQEGIGEYNLGVKALSNKEYTTAQVHLKNTEKKLKRGKINDDGLNFTRGNLAIAFLASGEKRGIGQSKRHLGKLTPKIYKDRKWTYNLAVAHYTFATNSRGATKSDYMSKAIKLFKIVIKTDKLFLPAHENLIYIYKEIDEDNKAIRAQQNYEKCRNELIKSFSRQDQLALGMSDLHIFRVKLGTFGEYNTPAALFDEDELITIPINENNTTYIAGMFYNLENAIKYQKRMLRIGYENALIIAYKNGNEIEF